MPKTLRHAIANREQWPDTALRQLAHQVDAEIDRREQQSQPQPAEADLSTLEERLKAEAKRYQKGDAAIRG
ncbi:MAG: hypothetical protein R6V11_02520 [Ectothiorhodospiraceae bacterium]